MQIKTETTSLAAVKKPHKDPPSKKLNIKHIELNTIKHSKSSVNGETESKTVTVVPRAPTVFFTPIAEAKNVSTPSETAPPNIGNPADNVCFNILLNTLSLPIEITD